MGNNTAGADAAAGGASLNGPLHLLLFTAGANPQSLRAVARVQQLCTDYFKPGDTLEVIDVYQQPDMAANEQIIALPMIIRKSPPPVRRVIGDLSDLQRVAQILGLVER